MKKYFIIPIALSILLFANTGCNKTTPVKTPTIDDINVPDGFTYETTREVDIKIVMPGSVDFNNYRGRFDIYTTEDGNKNKHVYSGSFNKAGIFEGTIKIPNKIDELLISTIAGNMIIAVPENQLKEGGVTADFGDDYIKTPPDSVTVLKNTFNKTTSTYKKTLTTVSPVNMVTNGDFEVNDFDDIFWWSTPHPVDQKWHRTTKYAPGEWYNDGGNHVARSPYLNGHYAGGFSQMITVSPGNIVTFTGDIKASFPATGNQLRSWMYLIPYNSAGSPIDYFAVEYVPPATTWTSKQLVATMPANTVKCQVLFWAHDLKVNGSVMFDNAIVTITGPDSDNDGVPDDDDDYPNDPERAFNVYYPNETDWGTLAFEDLWPGKGDYDFNDLIFDYHFKSVLNAQNNLVEFFTDYSVRAVGASLENGLGFMIGGDPSNVATITGTRFTENYINLNANGTEQNQTNTVIVLFDNSFSMIDPSGSTFINTKPEVPYVDPDTNQLYVYFTNPVSTSITGTAPYNPFLIVDKTRGKEVHLSGNIPTDLADTALFGTWADDSDPATGKYYQTVNNLPWALDLPVSFDYPVEQIEIIHAYNHFVEWAESGGSSYPDWYEDNAGYRNSTNIYTPAP